MRKGFSLVELLLGFLILMLGLASLLRLFTGPGLQCVMRARDQAIAVNLCERFLNIAKAELQLAEAPRLGVTDLRPEFAGSDTLQRSLQSGGNLHLVRVDRTIAPCPPSRRLFRVTVAMQWSNQPAGGRTETVSLSTMVCVPEAR